MKAGIGPCRHLGRQHPWFVGNHVMESPMHLIELDVLGGRFLLQFVLGFRGLGGYRGLAGYM